MKYKVGDRVKIKNSIEHCDYMAYGMLEYQGKIMTVTNSGEYGGESNYRMKEDRGGWCWYEDMIEELAEPSNTEVLQRAIDTYGVEKQALVCIEEMSELTKALIKLYRAEGREEKESARDNVREEVADVKIMLQQMSMIFNEKKIAEIQEQKIERLRVNLEDEKPAEIVIGVHKCGGKSYMWQNPHGYHVEAGGAAMAETKYGEYPIIVEEIVIDKKKNAKQHRSITGGIRV